MDFSRYGALSKEEEEWLFLDREKLLDTLIVKDRTFHRLLDLNINLRKKVEKGRRTDRERMMLIINAMITKYGTVSLSQKDLDNAKHYALSYTTSGSGSGTGAIEFTEIPEYVEDPEEDHESDETDTLKKEMSDPEDDDRGLEGTLDPAAEP